MNPTDPSSGPGRILQVRQPAPRKYRAERHGDGEAAEHEPQPGWVVLNSCRERSPCTRGKGAKLAASGGDTVGGAAVLGWEDLSGDL
jgi:hypothetical protein